MTVAPAFFNERLIQDIRDTTVSTGNLVPEGSWHAFFGPNPSVVASVWADIILTDIDLGLKQNDKTERGFRRLLIALHFLWAYPKNAKILAITTGTNKKNG